MDGIQIISDGRGHPVCAGMDCNHILEANTVNGMRGHDGLNQGNNSKHTSNNDLEMKCVPLGLISLKNNGARPSSVFTTTNNGIESMPQIHHEEDTNDNILTLNSDYDETVTNTLLNKLLQSQLAVQMKNKTMKQRNQHKMGSKALPIRHKTRRLVRIA